MKKPFQVGDRVRVYAASGQYIGTVTKIVNADCLELSTPQYGKEKPVVWAKQCRRLLIKKKPRSILIQCGKDGGLSHAAGKLCNKVKFDWEGHHSIDDGYVKFIEVRSEAGV